MSTTPVLSRSDMEMIAIQNQISAAHITRMTDKMLLETLEKKGLLRVADPVSEHPGGTKNFPAAVDHDYASEPDHLEEYDGEFGYHHSRVPAQQPTKVDRKEEKKNAGNLIVHRAQRLTHHEKVDTSETDEDTETEAGGDDNNVGMNELQVYERGNILQWCASAKGRKALRSGLDIIGQQLDESMKILQTKQNILSGLDAEDSQLYLERNVKPLIKQRNRALKLLDEAQQTISEKIQQQKKMSKAVSMESDPVFLNHWERKLDDLMTLHQRLQSKLEEWHFVGM